MARSNLMLAVDCGTQSLRTMIFDPSGSLLDMEKLEYNPYYSSRPGWAEQDAELYWNSLVQGCQALAQRSPRLFSRLAGVGVTAQRDSMVNLASDGHVLRPAIIWLDTRKAKGSYHPGPLMRRVYRSIGKDAMVKKTMRDGKCNWIRENQRDVWEKTWKYVQVSGFLNFRLCGECADSVASMVGHVPMDSRHRKWASPQSLKGRLFPIEKEKLSPLVEPGTVIGKITKEAAQKTGLRQGLPVIACGSDKSCESLGMGCLDPSVAALSFGTTATVGVTTLRYFEPLPFLPAYCAAVPGRWVPEVEIYRGYWMLRWFRDEFGQQETDEAQRLGVLPEELLDRLLQDDPPGCRGLMMQPYWGPCLKDPLAKGSFIGFGDVHTRGSVYRATVEGLGHALRDGLETLEQRGHFRSQAVAVAGGASRSDLICQITADIFNRPLYRGQTHEASGLGAAIITAVALGVCSTLPHAVESMTGVGREFLPQKQNAAVYEQLHDVYRRIYPRMKHLYREIQQITGYPEV
ncbi:MAG: FGGY-family carbohydrate kinase [Spirochaetales bacterium]|nr:FGGY-family carbohydrate kinase [Spirochaetales bacterium]